MTHASPADATPLLSIRDLEVRYGPALALSHITLDVNRGDVIALLGSNGAGKSTLARTISGLVPVASGELIYQGIDISKRAAYHRRKDGILRHEGLGELSNSHGQRSLVDLGARWERGGGQARWESCWERRSERREMGPKG